MQGYAVVRRQPWRREAVWGRSPRRTAAPNASELLGKPDRPGERVCERDAQNPTEVGAVVGAGAAGHPVFLPREVCRGPRER
jgi:hypothetical protein